MALPDSSAAERGERLRLEPVQQLTEAVSRAESLGEIYELALSCLEQTLGTDRASVLLFDEAGVMRFVAWHGLSEAYRAAVDGHSPWSPSDRETPPVLVPDVREATDLESLLPVFAAEDIRALAFVPLRAGGELIGKFMLYYAEPHRFEPDEVVLAQIVAGHVAFAVGQRRKDLEVSRARDELDAILRSVGDGLTVTETSGEIVYANDAAVGILGFKTRDELLSTPAISILSRYDLFHEDGRPFEVSELPGRRAVVERQPVTTTMRFVHRDTGVEKWALVTASPIFREEGSLAVNVFRDVTSAHQTEEALRRSERQMREAYAAARDAEERKDEFLAILGHELRNPLAPIVTALQLMKLKGGDAFVRERMIVDRQVQHLMRLVDDLLDVSRITRGKLTLKRQPIDIAAILERAAELAGPLLEQRSQVLVVAVEKTLAVDADPQRLTQVVANLLTNAAKNSPERGRISISARSSNGRVELSVSDEGVGIEPELLPRLFELFVQGRQTLGREKGGLGLGLTIVKRLIELHGGSVRVASDGPGKGATFTVVLPEAAVSPAPPPAIADDTGEHAPVLPCQRVLVVDDNADAADTLADALAAAGYTTRVAYDGPSGLEAAASFKPDVAILDIGMPVMDGYELARRLREPGRSRPLRLIALTGYGQSSDRAKTAKAGFDLHLTKPIGLRELLDAVAVAR